MGDKNATKLLSDLIKLQHGSLQQGQKRKKIATWLPDILNTGIDTFKFLDSIVP